MSVYSFAFAGTTPIGNFFAGSVTEKLGAGMGFLWCGAGSLFFLILTVLSIVFKKARPQVTGSQADPEI